MYRYSLTGYDKLGSLQSKQSTVDSDEATVSATRTITPANRQAAVDIPDEFTLGSLSYMAASPDYLMPSFRRFGMSRFSVLGTLFANRPAAVNSAGGYAEGRSYAVPDVTGVVSVTFEEVYDI